MNSALDRALDRIQGEFSPVALASSLSVEDMVLTDAIAHAGLPIEIFALDTGRLHADTLAMIQTVYRRYGLRIAVYTPDAEAVADYVAANGRDAFYDSVAMRQRCCHIRKVEPLERALRGKRAWITGQRREHSQGRGELAEREYDGVHGIEKFNPLAAWREAELWSYVHARRVPYNRLYDQGYRSIGCAPCTRPVLPGEEVRAGRWWWEHAGHRECGIHPVKKEAANAA